MTTREREWGLPILTKDLIEQSARLRTYIIRSVYAVLLFGFALFIFWGEVYDRVSSPLELLGQGGKMFFILMLLQTIGIMLFTPALTCGALTVEKERNTFGLLILTRLGPTSILLEKWLGRVFVMVTYLLISLPLFGFCYSLGGVEQKDVWAAVFALIATIMQLAAIGVMCSAFFRTTVGAFIASYLISLAVLFGPLFLWEFLDLGLMKFIADVIWAAVRMTAGILAITGEKFLEGVNILTGLQLDPDFQSQGMLQFRGNTDKTFVFNAPIIVMSSIESRATSYPLWFLLSQSIPTFISSFFFLLVARLVILRRAFVQPRNLVLNLFRWLDRIAHSLNDRYFKGMVLTQEKENLPDDHPVAWRETTLSSLGTWRYLVRLFIFIEFPVAAICLLVAAMGNSNVYRQRNEILSLMVMISWVLAVLFISVRAATIVSRERSHETLDVLLVSPISAAQLVSQKFAGVRRLMWVVSIPLLTIIFTQSWLGSVSHGTFFSGLFQDKFERSMIGYLLISISCVLLYFPMVARLSFLIGIWTNSPTKAIFISLITLVAWIVLPVVLLIVSFETLGIRPGDGVAKLLLFSPASIIAFTEFNDLDDLGRNVWATWFLNLFIYAGALITIMWLTSRNAAAMLGRYEVDFVHPSEFAIPKIRNDRRVGDSFDGEIHADGGANEGDG